MVDSTTKTRIWRALVTLAGWKTRLSVAHPPRICFRTRPGPMQSPGSWICHKPAWKYMKVVFYDICQILFVYCYFQVQIFDILSQCAALLGSELANDYFMEVPDVQTNDCGSRLYGELNTGEWWQKTISIDKMENVSYLFWFLLI